MNNYCCMTYLTTKLQKSIGLFISVCISSCSTPIEGILRDFNNSTITLINYDNTVKVISICNIIEFSIKPLAYVVNSGDNTVSVINTTTNAVIGLPIPVGITPEGIAITPMNI